jgi:hypothetical protein
LLDKPVRPANNAAAAKHLEFKKDFREWTNRNSGIVGKLWTACKQEKIAHDIIIGTLGRKKNCQIMTLTRRCWAVRYYED